MIDGMSRGRCRSRHTDHRVLGHHGVIGERREPADDLRTWCDGEPELDRSVCVVGDELGDRACRNQLAAHQDGHRRIELFDLGEVVRGVHDGRALVGGHAHDIEQRMARIDVGPDCRLVEQQQRRFVQEGNRGVHAATLAPGEPLHRSIEQMREAQRRRDHVDPRHSPRGPAARAARRSPPGSRVR